MPVVAETMADGNGNFNFGEVRPGHYVLRIKSANLEDSFDVEVVRNKKTKSILLDISPVFPDCTGGHLLQAESEN
ncbi:MAG TPA: hypothetical protein VGQ71_09420 [Terriglobales bacterium]|jgi:hypothetical protein|nr:hypothetical protein [Terriglobales bacterium]